MLSNKHRKLMDKILTTMKLADPTLTNYNYYKKKFTGMDDKAFLGWLKDIKAGKDQIHMYAPNLKVTLQFEDLEAAGKYIGLSFFQPLVMRDVDTGVEFESEEKYFITQQSVRRLQQTLDEKMSIPRSDMKIDGMTGQVTGEDRSASLTNPEMHCMKGKGYTKAIKELAVVRGGNLHAYAKMKQQLEETGEARVDDVLDGSGIARSVVVLDAYLRAMGYTTNLVTGRD